MGGAEKGAGPQGQATRTGWWGGRGCGRGLNGRAPTREGMGAGLGAEWAGPERGRAPRAEPLARRVGTPAHRASSRSCLWYSSARAYSFR